jgi:hypothetical protein
VLSIAVIRERVRGGGSEFTLGCDIRFASREKAIFGQPEVGTGLIPGGGAMERLPLLVGRSRALEIVLGANDFDADTAERYGWINRAVADAELDAFVANFVARVLSFDRQALQTAKSIINHTGLPDPDALQSTQDIFFQTFSWEGAKERAPKLRDAASDRWEILSCTWGITSAAFSRHLFGVTKRLVRTCRPSRWTGVFGKRLPRQSYGFTASATTASPEARNPAAADRFAERRS